MGWIVGYFIVGALFAAMAYVRMRSAGYSVGKSMRPTLGMLFAWPLMLLYVVIMAVFFTLTGGLF